MRAVIQIRLTSPWLGDMSIEPGQGVFGHLFTSLQRPAYAMRPFSRDANRTALDLQHWAWAWQQVMPALHFEAVRLDPYVMLPTTTISRRAYFQHSNKLYAHHQTVNVGTVLSVGAEIVEPSPAFTALFASQCEQPTKEQLLAALSRIGESLGISSYFSTHGYGRFIPIDIIFDDTSDDRLGRDQSGDNSGAAQFEGASESDGKDHRTKEGDH